MRQRKVLFVINTLGKAGAEVALMELLRRLLSVQDQWGDCKLKLDLYVLTAQGELKGELPREATLLNRAYSDVPVLSAEGRRHLLKKVAAASLHHGAIIKNLPGLLSNGLRMLKKGKVQTDKLLWRVLSDGADFSPEEYDLAVSFLEGGSAYYVADHVKARKKAAFIHVDYQQAGYTRALDHDCYLKFDRIFTVSGEVSEAFLAVYPECREKTMIFHNLLDEKRIHDLAGLPGGFADEYDGVRILTVGRLVYQKGYDVAIQAMRLLKEAGVRARWYVLGEGEKRKELEAQIEGEELTEDFLLCGAVENPYPYYAQADIYAHFTRFEGKSIAVQEAQILAKPIAASDCSGNREQIRSGEDGLLCDFTPEAMKEALCFLINNPEAARSYGLKARTRQQDYEGDMQLLLELL
ncbi:MAG: glycosyltransferase [Lachnospiraceae bacterium]|nr:glycosyltransferase [Lachnospiraceae bacterium]